MNPAGPSKVRRLDLPVGDDGFAPVFTSTPAKSQTNTPNPVRQLKKRPVIYLTRGHGGKVVGRGRGGGRGGGQGSGRDGSSASTRHSRGSCASTEEPGDGNVTASSGQMTSGDDAD
jgi:hypothetical protein